MKRGPRVIAGGLFQDARGSVQHVNAFNFEGVDRFYTLSPPVGMVRGWVGHQRDWKWFFAVKGALVIAVVEPDDWTAPSRALSPVGYTLTAESPAVLEVPPGYMTAMRAHQADSTLLVFSSGRIEDAASDDFRLAPDYWPLPAVNAPA